MSAGRRASDRRRRVLYSTHHADPSGSTAASRREFERLRAARRPTAAYAARVQRRLRGRWFSLVPVRRRTFAVVATILVAVSLVLCTAHYAAVSWPALADHAEVARPLRIDRADSFARWFLTALLAASAGASLLIYQLRRYRNDDYTGQYRLWRLVLIVMLMGSIHSMVSLIDWTGALLDVAFGKRVALAGHDWVRLVVSFGAAVLALRLLAEVRRCRIALASMIAASLLLLIPEAAKWNVLSVDTRNAWVLVTSAPLLACTALFLALGGYLRSLYREVREIDDSVALSARWQQLRIPTLSLAWLRRDESSDDRPPATDKTDRRAAKEEDTADHDDDAEPKKRWWQRRGKPLSTAAADATQQDDDQADDEPKQSSSPAKESDDDAADQSPRPRRRWFGLRAAKVPSTRSVDEDGSDEPSNDGDAESDPPPATKRGRFSMRLKPRSQNVTQQTESQPTDPAEADADGGDEENPPKRRGLGWFGRRKSAEAATGLEAESTPTKSAPAARQSDDEEDDDESADQDMVNDDSVDWDSLSKADRRRMRKQLKRNQRAA